MKNVVIVGRPNVGKSSLFNRIIRRRKAVVEELPGVTRDRLLHRAEWRGTSFYLTDTGGYIPSKKDKLTSLVSKQVELAIEEGDIILFTLDAKEGVTPLDKEIAISLRKSSKKVFVVVNKVDNKKRQEFIYDFFNLGFDDIFPVSSIHGLGIADLLDKVVDLIKQEQEDVEEIKEGIKIAIVGKPNVGKSSFFNKIINKERVIVDENPGTTRDAIDTELEFEGEKLTLIDTAGIRRKPKIKTDVEYYTVKRAIDSLVLCDVALVMVDGSTDLTRQDKRLITLAGRTAGCVIILLNKIDLVPKRLRKKAVLYFQNVLRYLPYLLLLPISAKNGEGVYDAIR
ncbi:MAG: ribosome biogenesis GTPase Der, partial [Candidatus Cloacimonas sp. 4484_209]